MNGRVLTRSFEFQTKQHSLLGLDLGDGVARDFLVLGTLGTALWFGGLTLLFGLPSPQTILVYLTLPLVVFFFGFQPDPKRERRKRLTTWILWIRYAFVGHRPIINGARSTRRTEFIPWQCRFDVARIRSWFAKDEVVWEPKVHDNVVFKDAETLNFDFSAILIGFDAMTHLRTPRKRRRKNVNV